LFAPRTIASMTTGLAKWMEETGISDEELAEKGRVNRTTISRIRRGKLRPSVALIQTLIGNTPGLEPEVFLDILAPPQDAA
jgi:transcriptional regulator with XRE-family HTH domain